MPPERVIGSPAEERSDLYALGCVAYWMLTGQTVFTGEPMAMMIHHARTDPKPPSQVSGLPIPERLEEIVLACLEKTPQKRPSSAVELWRQLGDVPLETPWTPERAEAWWRSSLPDLSSPGPRADSTGELTNPQGQ
jgi:serine/threonine-protein kinase